MRTKMWDGVSRRQHWVTNMVGSLSGHGVEVMLKGGVRIQRSNGRESVHSWAGSANWVSGHGVWQMETYRVWLDKWTAIDGPLPAESEFTP